MAKDQTQCARDEDLTGQLGTTLRHFMHLESTSAALLVVASLLALAWANSPWSAGYEHLWETGLSVRLGDIGLSMNLHHWVNDGLMVVFFFVVGLEVRRELAVGELTDRRRTVVPLIAGAGGLIVPALLYLMLNPSGEAARGWGVVIGTDTAFLLGMLALVGPTVSTQLRIFLLTLTVIDDIVAVSVIGVAYTDQLELGPLVVAAVALVGIFVLDRVKVWRAAPYVLLVLIAWVATLGAGLHASIAGMLAGLLVPAAEPTRAQMEVATSRFRAFRQSPLPTLQRETRDELTRTISVNERLQESLHVPTSYLIVPVFALANAGVDLRDGVLGEALSSPVTWGVVIGLVLGKTLGIGAGAYAATRTGLGRLPQGVGGGHVLGGAALSGIGFTVALLITTLAFESETLQRDAVVGVLISVVLASALGWVIFQVAARFLGQRDAALPKLLSPPVDPDRDHIYGDEDAEVTLVEYLDYECPFCARATGTANEVRDYFGSRIRYVVRHLPLAQHPHAELAALAVEAAARQGRFWEMHRHLFNHQDQLEHQDLAGYAADLELDVEQFVRDMEDPDLAEHVRQDMASADASGARGTPTFFIGNRRHEGRYDARTLIAALERSATTEAPRLGTRTRR
ncbi:Na+/H+ antiporter NhaA [Nocardioides luteus]|uniref:Na(+)/H(+) antiporter NhaA n=1 Tax=Nocardioides luteus TaxID=1844 RepID=A0ABQ5T142_9ACTN|nr:Na+/H+ antiporter NhaA [Nocardioides luteus]MDR7310267.1 Na+/H+ antiporter NhaA [Nocardioides luteus]GGR53810.1 Na(+)/H(+) antiporter NhaA 2 [Nocardioides luteus]GLJ69954.1 Na(+)/H(+) antiporter NhaA 2 [Nocardioides luteus]